MNERQRGDESVAKDSLTCWFSETSLHADREGGGGTLKRMIQAS